MEPITAAFVARLQERPEASRLVVDPVDAHLTAWERRCRVRWPAIGVNAEALGADLADRIDAPPEALASLEALHLDDLFLAIACSHRDPAALQVFWRDHDAQLRAVHRKASRPETHLDDFLQVVNARLFAEARPQIRGYSGRGPLGGWLRVVTLRMLLNMQRRERREEPAEPAALDPATPDDDPELAYLKRVYRQEFAEAFEAAAASLDPAARNLLRAHLVQRLSIDAIAASRGIHRATAARRLARAKEDLLRNTRQLLYQRLGLSRPELESVMRLIESQLHVTAARVFGAA